MALIQRTQRLENFWFGLLYSLQTREVYYSLWERNEGELTKILLEMPNSTHVYKKPSFHWGIRDHAITMHISNKIPEIVLPPHIEAHEIAINLALKSLEWKSIPNITSTLSSLSYPILREPLCVVRGMFKESPTTFFIPCAGKSVHFHDHFREWARYDQNIQLIESSPYSVDGYIVEDTKAMNDFFVGEKVKIITSNSDRGVYIRGREELKQYLRSIVKQNKSLDDVSSKPTIMITLLETGQNISI